VASAPGLLSDNIAGGGLQKETNWWGAFVIGLAGTILVTGIAPIMVNAFGAAAIPQMAVITLSGYLLCLLLAELSAMMPDRTGGSPTYAMVAYKDKRPRLAGHINGATCWAYWLGWFPVAPLNMILASFYLKDRFGWGDIGTFTPLSTPIAWTTVIIAVVGIVAIFIPAYMGIRLGAAFATVLGLLAMIPLTFLALGSVFRADIADWSQLSGFPQVDGSSFFSDAGGHGWFAIYLAFAFLLTWNVIAMEAAACYIGECKNPERDAKIAMNLSGAYGAFIYIMIPVSMVVIIGREELAGIGFDPKTVFVTFAGKLFGGTAGSFLNWAIAIMLIVALALSALNAIMGCARGLHQMAIDGQFPRIFARVNKHGVPSFAMGFNVLASIVVVFMGGAVQIYLFSNVGYLSSFLPVLLGYYLLRKNRPEIPRPVRLPPYFAYVALAMFAFYLIIWAVGGPLYASLPLDTDFDPTTDNGDGKIYWILGLLTLLSYIPFYLYRRYVEDKRHPSEPVAPLTDVELSEVIRDK
jgi:amino acid transporter